MPNVAFKREEVKAHANKWALIRDCLAGEETVKAEGEKYLPIPDTSGTPAERKRRYEAYRKRAVFFNVTGRTLEGLSGQIFAKETTTELPPDLEFFESDVDGAGSTLEQQAKSVLHKVLSLGRGGLLADFPTVPEGVVTKADLESRRIRPRVIHYDPEAIINWRETNEGGETYLTLLVLEEEKAVEDDGFEMKSEPRWRVLTVEENRVFVTIYKENQAGTQDADRYVIEEGPIPLLDHRSQPLRRIPFEFVGAKNNDSSVDEPPLYNIASLNVAHYRNSADLEESSFLVGQPMYVFAGLQKSWVDNYYPNGINSGSRSAVLLNEGASGEILQPEPNQLPGELMKHKEEQMRALGAKLIEPGKVQRTAMEVGIEESSETSVLSSAAQNVSQAYRKAIWHASKFLGEFPEEKVIFELNTDFELSRMTAEERKQLLMEWQGELITWGEARDALRKNGVVFEDDKKARDLIEGEAAFRSGNADGLDE